MILRREVQKIRSGKWEELEEVYRNYKSEGVKNFV
mgnify:CR=1 FL=1